jgi:hypothetical protein
VRRPRISPAIGASSEVWKIKREGDRRRKSMKEGRKLITGAVPLRNNRGCTTYKDEVRVGNVE